ncbi:MAG: DUF938 domain-containing protein [Rhodobacteraceae bacterium]|nr:DUF938 domain-containing protein [Paracoccaceae bacterium]
MQTKPGQPHSPDTAARRREGVRLIAPAAERNLGPILEVVALHAPIQGLALELASGTGQHAAAICRAHPGLSWQPTDLDDTTFESIAAWGVHLGTANLRPAALLDAGRPGWGITRAPVDLVLAVNLLHLITEAEARAALHGMAEVLAPGGVALIYGPFLRADGHASAGDAAFDAHLRAQGHGAGYKPEALIRDMWQEAGLTVTRHEMPASNLMFAGRRAVPAA